MGHRVWRAPKLITGQAWSPLNVFSTRVDAPVLARGFSGSTVSWLNHLDRDPRSSWPPQPMSKVLWIEFSFAQNDPFLGPAPYAVLKEPRGGAAFMQPARGSPRKGLAQNQVCPEQNRGCRWLTRCGHSLPHVATAKKP